MFSGGSGVFLWNIVISDTLMYVSRNSAGNLASKYHVGYNRSMTFGARENLSKQFPCCPSFRCSDLKRTLVVYVMDSLEADRVQKNKKDDTSRS